MRFLFENKFSVFDVFVLGMIWVTSSQTASLWWALAVIPFAVFSAWVSHRLGLK